MILSEVTNVSLQMLQDFLNKIGLNGEYYISCMGVPHVFYLQMQEFDQNGELTCGHCYLKKREVDNLLRKYDFTEKQKEYLEDNGAIGINSYLAKNKVQLIKTFIHEYVHYCRTVMIEDIEQIDDGSYVFDDCGRYFGVPFYTDDKEKERYADFSQDIFKANVYGNIYDKDQISKLSETDVLGTLDKQFKYDEAMVELIANLCYRSYGNDKDIFEIVQGIGNEIKDDTIKELCQLISDSRNMDWFYWMFCPLESVNDCIHYDYLEKLKKKSRKK